MDEIWQVMATYEYTCTEGHLNIQERPMKENQTIFTCDRDNCNAELLRVWDATPSIFKGPGFYKTGG